MRAPGVGPRLVEALDWDALASTGYHRPRQQAGLDVGIRGGQRRLPLFEGEV